jgi:hypothetical protein
MAVFTIRFEEAGVETRFGVAGRTFLRDTLKLAIRMALRALDPVMRPGEQETGFGMIKYGLLPIYGGVAAGAILPELAGMGVVLFMTAKTIGGDPLKGCLGMALGALDFQMASSERKNSLAVIEC